MKNKIFALLAIVVIIIGIIMVCILGFNVDICYNEYQLIEINIEDDFNIADIKSITNEVLNNTNVEIQKAGDFNDTVIIKAGEVSNEQLELLNTKINEKYGLENTINDIQVNYIPAYKLRDIIKPYFIPLAITTVLILIYLGIRFKKIGVSKVISQIITLTIVGELLYAAIIAISRYPVNRLVMPVGIIIYIAIITMLTGKFEKQIIKEKKEESI